MEPIDRVIWTNLREAWLQVDWPSGIIRAVNPAFEKLCGLNQSRLIGSSFWDLLMPGSVKRLQQWQTDRRDSREASEQVGLWLRSEEKSIPVSLRTFPTTSAEGDQCDWVVIEDRRNMQALAVRLDEVDARLDETERIARLGWWEWDVRQDRVSASETLPRMLGLPGSPTRPLTLNDFLQLLHPDDREMVRQRHEAALRGEPYFADFRAVRSDGKLLYLHAEGRMERDDTDQPIRLFGTCQDVTERVESLLDLRGSEQKYRELVETSRELVWQCDTEGRLQFVNSAVREIYGYEPDEMLGQPFFRFVESQQLPGIRQTFQRVLSGESLANYEAQHLRKDGTPVTISFNAIAKRDSFGNVIGATGTGIDVTERKRQEQQLQERESWFRAIFENDPQFLMILSLDGRMLDLNPNANRLLQVESAKELQNRLATDCLAPESHYSFMKSVTAAAHGAARPWQALLQGRRGGRNWLEGQMVPLRNARGEVDRLLAAAQDITARRKADALRDGEQQVLEEIASGHGLAPALQALIKLIESQLPGALAVVCLMDERDSYLRVAACSSMSEDVIRRLSSIRVAEGAPSFAESAATGVQRIIDDTTTDPSWEPLRAFADRFQLRSCWSEPIRGFSNNVLGVLTIFSLWPKSPTPEDLKMLETAAYLAGIAAHRTRSEQRLRDSELRFRTLFEHSPDGIFVESFSGVVLDVNPAACALHGLPRRELIGKHVIDLVPPRWRDDVRRAFPKLVRGDLREFESFSWHPERGEIPVSMHVSKIEYAFQPALLLHVRDITERRNAEAKAREIDMQLAHAGRLVVMGELVAGISHEINQPLYAISNFANACKTVLQGEGHIAKPQLLEWLQKIGDQATRAGDIIRRMRDFGRKSPQQRTDVDVADMIHEATELIAVETRANQIQLQSELPSKPLLVSMDRVQIQQVLVNILRNAIRAVSDNAPNDRIVTIATEADDKSLTVSIRDNGLGLQGQDPDKIFHPFHTTKPDGLGLGLTISQSIIEAHHGRLWATENADRGVTFHFTLPLPRTQAEPAPAPPTTAQAVAVPA